MEQKVAAMLRVWFAVELFEVVVGAVVEVSVTALVLVPVPALAAVVLSVGVEAVVAAELE